MVQLVLWLGDKILGAAKERTLNIRLEMGVRRFLNHQNQEPYVVVKVLHAGTTEDSVVAVQLVTDHRKAWFKPFSFDALVVPIEPLDGADPFFVTTSRSVRFSRAQPALLTWSVKTVKERLLPFRDYMSDHRIEIVGARMMTGTGRWISTRRSLRRGLRGIADDSVVVHNDLS